MAKDNVEIEVKPEEVKPEEVKPEEVKPEEVKPEEVKPEEVKPITLKVESACPHCGAKGLTKVLEFDSVECKQAYINSIK